MKNGSLAEVFIYGSMSVPLNKKKSYYPSFVMNALGDTVER